MGKCFVYEFEIIRKNDCIQGCLEDCNCEAAFFDGTNCRKQRLPLRYGRRANGTSNIALIKVGVPKPDTDRRIVQPGSKKKGRPDILIICLSFTALIHFVDFREETQCLGIYKNECCELNESVAPRRYAYEELEKMTNNFKEELGRGVSSTVYKGLILGNQSASYRGSKRSPKAVGCSASCTFRAVRRGKA
ncbi:hypothetical protein Pyn_06111 [Prunus yedoensis var. nudiflora]|uniref:Apple domain-containing protein n=1 Tax=Prunus yedoensis var. nudiflora TaxID=2094558 RepID=A0A314Z3R8_PRUYE|nr:hypothetical protein Pyn_06111 [Prunus yedoensis var. nudiflora]